MQRLCSNDLMPAVAEPEVALVSAIVVAVEVAVAWVIVV